MISHKWNELLRIIIVSSGCSSFANNAILPLSGVTFFLNCFRLFHFRLFAFFVEFAAHRPTVLRYVCAAAATRSYS